MKLRLLNLLLLLSLSCFAQQDTLIERLTNSDAPYLKRNYPSLQYHYIDSPITHDYSGNWDFDGDGKKDSILFIGNGGAHVYYHLQIKLSSEKKKRDYPSIEIDFPAYGFGSVDKANTGYLDTGYLPQFLVYDFDNDGLPDIYIHCEDEKSMLKRIGVSSPCFILTYKQKRMILKNYKRRK